MKPLYMEMECLMCHTYPEAMLPKIRKYIEKNYPNDDSFEYHSGELRGGISVVIPIEDEFVFEFLSKK